MQVKTGTTSRDRGMPKEYFVAVSRKGQVTIPVAIRRQLGLKPNKKVAFRVANGEVKIEPSKATLEAAYGAVKPLTRPEDFERLVRVAHQDQVDEASK